MIEAAGSDVTILRQQASLSRPGGVAPALISTILVAALILPRFALTFGQRELSLTVVVTLVSVAILAGMGELRGKPAPVGVFFLATARMLTPALLGTRGAQP